MSVILRGKKTLLQRALAILRRPDITAHAYIAGANGVTVSGLLTNNYTLITGAEGYAIRYADVDEGAGLVLDGMGSLGAEKVINGSFDSDTAWTKGIGVTISGGKINYTGFTTSSTPTTPITIVAGNTYKLVVTGVTYVSGELSVDFGGVSVGLPGAVSQFVKATTTASLVLTSAAFEGSVGSISIQEYTGTHLTQATTANKPLVQRGMLNELLNSATPATQSVTCIAAPYTLALYGTGNVVLSGTGAGTLTGTGAADLVVLNFTPTAGSVTFTKAGTVSSFGLFKGTWTAAQILAEGGIPTTTATAASNPSAGKYWWSFDGSNDSLLSGNLGITNACTIVIAGRVNTLPANTVLIGEDVNGVQISIASNGEVSFTKKAVVILVTSAAGTIVAGVPFVITCRLSAGTAVIRKLGTQVATAATAQVFAATTGARIGSAFDTTLPLNGALGWVVPLPTALSDADCLTVERLVSSQFPNGPVF